MKMVYYPRLSVIWFERSISVIPTLPIPITTIRIRNGACIGGMALFLLQPSKQRAVIS